MDENIYDDLENYNEVNLIKELRDENKELKTKLDEYASSMDNLQKEFDKLSAEFNNLEKNYSSLLKTARAEIERKTAMITRLNLTKDKMVLNSIQNRNRYINRPRCVPPNEIKDNQKANTATADILSDKSQVKSEDSNSKAVGKHERIEESRIPSEDTFSNLSTDKSNTENKISTNIDSRRNTCKQVSQQKHPKEYINDENKNSYSIKNRRKSVPVLSNLYPNLSSDEEFEEMYKAESLRQLSNTEDRSRIFLENQYYERKSHRISEKFNTRNDKYKHQHSKDIHYHKENYSAHAEYDKYRSREYNYTKRKRYYSPERKYINKHKDFTDDFHSTRRTSPPSAKRTSPSLRRRLGPSSAKRNSPALRRRSSPSLTRQSSSSSAKRTSPSLTRRSSPPSARRTSPPSTRRINPSSAKRTSPSSTKRTSPSPSRFGQRRINRDRWGNIERSSQDPEYNRSHYYHDKNVGKHKAEHPYSDMEPKIKRMRSSPNKKQTNQFVSDMDLLLTCESPDYNMTESLTSSHIIKEILSTANTNLDDPRIFSEKYVKQVSGNRVTLSSEKGVDLKVINYNGNAYEQFCEERLNVISKNNLDPNTNVSLESGDNISGSSNPGREEINRCEKIDNRNSGNFETTLDSLESGLNQDISITTRTQTDIHNTGSVEVEKLEYEYNAMMDTFMSSDINRTDARNIELPDNHSDIKQNTPHLSFGICNQEYINRESTNVSQQNISNNPIIQTEIVAGDLELSDETNDCSESKKDIINTEIIDTKDINKKKSQKRKGFKTKDIKKDRCKESTKQTLKEKSDKKQTLTALFGDTSSLITAEDLKINAATEKEDPTTKYLSIFEDGQDAVDLSVEDMLMAQKRPGKTKPEDQLMSIPNSKEPYLELESNCDKGDNSEKNTTTETGIMNLNSMTNENVTLVAHKSENFILYGETQPDVVKTVVISTGIQSQLPSVNIESTDNVDTTKQLVTKHLNISETLQINALATSTPNKSLELRKIEDIDKEQINYSCPSVSNATVNECGTPDIKSCSDAKVEDSSKDPDVPDVLIILKRPRRYVKKT